MTQTVTPTETLVQLDHFAEIAASLRLAADRIETLVGSGLPKIGYFVLHVQPGAGANDDETARSVDAVTTALLGHPGQIQPMSDGEYHYNNGRSDEPIGAVGVRIYQSVSSEWVQKREQAAKLAERDAELATLRARIAELEGSTDRPAEAKPGTTCEELDDETPAEPVTRYVSFGPSHTDPLTGVPLVDKYVTIIAASAADCRQALLAKYGNRWCDSYSPDSPTWAELRPRLTEHDRIDVTAAQPVSESR